MLIAQQLLQVTAAKAGGRGRTLVAAAARHAAAPGRPD